MTVFCFIVAFVLFLYIKTRHEWLTQHYAWVNFNVESESTQNKAFFFITKITKSITYEIR